MDTADIPFVQLRRPRSLAAADVNSILRRDTSTTFLEADEEEDVFVDDQRRHQAAYINVGLLSQTLPVRSMMKRGR